jgi:hypothetical protein
MKQYKHLNEDQRDALIIGFNLLLDLTGAANEINPDLLIANISPKKNHLYFHVELDDYGKDFFFIYDILNKDPQDVQAEADAIRAKMDEFIAGYLAGKEERKAKKIAELEEALAILKKED